MTTTSFEIWPAERSDIVLSVPESRTDNSPQQVIAVLAAVEGLSVEDYLATTSPDLQAVRTLSRFSRDELLAAAMVAPDLRPVSVLGVLSSQHALELVAS